MISAVEALRLSPLTDLERTQVRDALVEAEAFVRKHMTFAGPVNSKPTGEPQPLEISFKKLSHAAVKSLLVTLVGLGWDANAQLLSEMPRFAGGQPIPHHWVVVFNPNAAAYREVAEVGALL